MWLTVCAHRDYAHIPQIDRLHIALAERTNELGVPARL